MRPTLHWRLMELLVRWMSRGTAGGSGTLHSVVNVTLSDGLPFIDLHATHTLTHRKRALILGECYYTHMYQLKAGSIWLHLNQLSRL